MTKTTRFFIVLYILSGAWALASLPESFGWIETAINGNVENWDGVLEREAQGMLTKRQQEAMDELRRRGAVPDRRFAVPELSTLVIPLIPLLMVGAVDFIRRGKRYN